MPSLNAKKQDLEVSFTAETGWTQRVRNNAQRRVELVRQDDELVQIIQRISKSANDENARELQKKTFTALSESLRNWETWGVIKLPTGTGKTWIFAMILKAFRKNWLILVPRIDLYDSTARDLQAAGFKSSHIHFLHEQTWGNAEDRMMSLLIDPDIDWKSWKNQCIMTYQGLTSMVRKNPEMNTFIRNHFDVVIEDEAHRGLWDRTKNATEELVHQSVDQVYDFSQEADAEEAEEMAIEWEAEKILKWMKYSYKFTATPDLLGKSVADDGEYVFYATVEDAVRTGAIILPQYVDMWSAYTRSAELDSWKVSDIEKLSEWDNFVDESGKSIRDKIIDAYIEKRSEHGTHLPWVAFASTIEHARQIVEVFESKWIQAARVTSCAGDISSKEATRRMDNWDLDVIVTVTKVSEGFDYPPLACAMWFCPSLSPAKIFQWNGRIMRITDKKKPNFKEDGKWKIIASPASYIIAPSEWFWVSSNTAKERTLDKIDIEKDLLDKDDSEWESKRKRMKLLRIGNFYEFLISKGEIDINSLSENIRWLIELSDSLRYEPGEEKEIDGVVYIWVTWNNVVLWVRWETILRNVKRMKIRIIHGKQKNGNNINLVPKSFIEGLKIDYSPEPWEEIVIDKIPYVGVTNINIISGVNWFTILRNAIRDGINIIKCRQKNGYSIHLVPKSFIEGLKVEHSCEPGKEIVINEVVYIGVSRDNKIIWLNWFTILKSAMREGIKVIQGKQKNGYNIHLVPKGFVEWMKVEYTCEPGKEIVIDEAVYIWVTQAREVLWLKWWTILSNAKKDGIKIFQWKQKNGANITLVPKSFLEWMKVEYTCEPGKEIVIDGTIYIGVSSTKIIMEVTGTTILARAKKIGIQIIEGKQKNGANINLVPKSFVEWMKVEYTCEPGKEIVINWETCIGVVRYDTIMWVKWSTILNNAKKAGIKIFLWKQKNWYNIHLIPKNFIEEMKVEYTCEPGKEIVIDEIIYTWVTRFIEISELKWGTIISNAKKTGIKIFQWKQKNWYNIHLIPKNFIEGLLITCEPGEELDIEGIIHIWVINKLIFNWISWTAILARAKKLGIKIIEGRQKSGNNINLVPKSFIENLAS